MSRTGKIVRIILITPLIIIGGFFLFRYLGYLGDKDPNKTFIIPRIEFSKLEITRLTKERTDMIVKMLVDNPLPFGYTVDSVGYSMYIQGREVIRSTYKERLQVGKGDSNWIALPVTMYNEKLINALEGAEQKGLDSVEYSLRASFYSDKLAEREFTINIKRNWPLIYIIGAELGKVEIDTFGLASTDLSIHLMIENKNVFDIRASDLGFRFAVGDNQWVESKISGLINFPGQSTTPYVMPVDVSVKDVARSVFRLNKHPYKMEMEFTVAGEPEFMRGARVEIVSEGEVKELIKFLKKDKGKKEKKKREGDINALIF